MVPPVRSGTCERPHLLLQSPAPALNRQDAPVPGAVRIPAEGGVAPGYRAVFHAPVHEGAPLRVGEEMPALSLGGAGGPGLVDGQGVGRVPAGKAVAPAVFDDVHILADIDAVQHLSADDEGGAGFLGCALQHVRPQEHGNAHHDGGTAQIVKDQGVLSPGGSLQGKTGGLVPLPDLRRILVRKGHRLRLPHLFQHGKPDIVLHAGLDDLHHAASPFQNSVLPIRSFCSPSLSSTK